MGRGTGGRSALIILLSERAVFVDSRVEDAVHAMTAETAVAEEIRRLVGAKGRDDWQSAALRHARAIEVFVQTWNVQLTDRPEEWEAISEDYNRDKTNLAESRRDLLTLLRGKQAATLAPSKPQRRVPGALVVSAVAAIGMTSGILLVHHSHSAQTQAQTGSTATPTPTASTSSSPAPTATAANPTTTSATPASSSPVPPTSPPPSSSSSNTTTPLQPQPSTTPQSSAVASPTTTSAKPAPPPSTTRPAAAPSTTSRPSGGSVTGVSASISGGASGSAVIVGIHVTTSGTGPVAVRLTVANSDVNGQPGSGHAATRTWNLSGKTSYDLSDTEDGAGYCGNGYVGALVSAGGRTAYADQPDAC